MIVESRFNSNNRLPTLQYYSLLFAKKPDSAVVFPSCSVNGVGPKAEIKPYCTAQSVKRACVKRNLKLHPVVTWHRIEILERKATSEWSCFYRGRLQVSLTVMRMILACQRKRSPFSIKMHWVGLSLSADRFLSNTLLGVVTFGSSTNRFVPHYFLNLVTRLWKIPWKKSYQLTPQQKWRVSKQVQYLSTTSRAPLSSLISGLPQRPANEEQALVIERTAQLVVKNGCPF